MPGGGDVDKEGVGYEESVLAYILCAPIEIGADHYVDLENAREWEINPKLFNPELLQIPFSIDVDFFIKKGSVYHVFFSKSTRKLAKSAPKAYFEKALATFCVLESRGPKKLRANFAYYYISDFIPWQLVEDLRTQSIPELQKMLVKAVGRLDDEESTQIFSQAVIESVKQKTVFCPVTEELIAERRARFADKFNDLLSEISPAKREVEQSIPGSCSSLPSNISIGPISSSSGKRYSIGNTTFWIGNLDKVLKAAKNLQESDRNFDTVSKFLEADFTFDHLTESEAMGNISELFNRIVFPENELEISLVITPNDYKGILFKHKELATQIRENFSPQTGKYNLAKVPLLATIDHKTAIDIATLAFSKGRSIELKESRFTFVESQTPL